MKRIRRRDGSIIAVGDSYVMQDGEAIAFDVMFMDGTRAGNYRTVRGRTLLSAIIDEVAFLRDETSSTPDIETYRALLPALATTGGMLIGISTPYRRTGLLHQKHRDYFGVDDPDVLAVAGASQQFNPTELARRARIYANWGKTT